MAFHTACPITSRSICDCELGFRGELKERRAREEFLAEVSRVEEFLDDPWILRDEPGGTVKIPVPPLVPAPPSPMATPSRVNAEAEDGGERERERKREREREREEAVASRTPTAWALSLKAKREELQQEAAAATQAAEEYIRRLEAGAAVGVPREVADSIVGEDQCSSTIKVICRICFSGESEGSERATKMLSCKLCNKKYHRSCLKIWAEYRDLFHWSSWACPSCRSCEVCRRTGDPTKLMYCKRCDDAYHCYCQMPPHKNVTHGPYLCPKHTRCHSCGSTVCGSGHSTRWFLSYTCCDACGRLFVKGNYCPVCLKVYRDSEMTPMVCCDVCQKWVHCACDGISDEKYQQFEKDGNLYYKCAACRGECYKMKDIDDAVRELWRRRDKADRDLTACLRSAAGLPSEEDASSLYPFSDDEESSSLLLKNDHGRSSLKFSGKGFSEKSSKGSKEYQKSSPQISFPNTKQGKKGNRVKFIGNPEEPCQNTETKHEPESNKSSFKDKKGAHKKACKSDGLGILLSPNIRSPGSDREKPLVEQESSSTIKEGVVNSVNSVTKVHMKGTTKSLHLKEGVANNVGKNEKTKGTKLVIHIGAKSGNKTSSPRLETSASQREQDFANGNGSGDTIQQKHGNNSKLETPGGIEKFVVGEGARLDNAAQTTSTEHEEREINVVNLWKVSDMRRKSKTNMSEEHKHSAVHISPLIRRKRSAEDEETLPPMKSVDPPINLQSQNYDTSEPFPSNSSDDPKPLLKLKFKKPFFEQRSSLASQIVEEKSSVKGKRSKRNRPSLEKLASMQEYGFSQPPQAESIDEVLDANWILQKLGRNAIGKRVEVHQSSDDSWNKGVISDIIEGSPSLSVNLDDGRPVTLELGKQGVRFIAQKQKRAKR